MGPQGIIVKTADGGVTWISQVSGTSSGLTSVYFVDAIHGWAVGSSASILKHIGSPTPILSHKPLGNSFGIADNGNLWYHLSHESHVSVLLLDSRGAMVLKLSETIQQAGYHDLNLPKDQMPSPVFLDLWMDKSHQSIMLPARR